MSTTSAAADTETELATRLEIGEAIWKLGSRSMLVRQDVAAGALDHLNDEQMGVIGPAGDAVNGTEIV